MLPSVLVLHFLTIGQAPRPDVTPEILRFLGRESEPATEAGVLDGLHRDAIPPPEPGETPLVSRLATGEEALVSERFVERRMRELVDRAPDGAGIAILCTGPLRGIPERPRLVKAGPAFDRALRKASPPGTTVGVLIPNPGQEADARRRVPEDCRAIVGVASPYTETNAVERLREQFGDTDRIALHCIGYSGAFARALEAATGKPVLLARRALAERIAEIAA